MKLLVITSFYPPHQTGGYELRCRDVVEGLKERGHEVLVLTDRCPSRHCGLHPGEGDAHRVLHQRADASNVFEQILHDRVDLRYIDRMVTGFKPDILYLWHIQDLSNAILPYFSQRRVPIVYDEGGSGLIYLARVHKRGIYFYRNDRDPLLKKWLKSVIYWIAQLVSFGLIKPEWRWPPHMRIYFNSRSGLEHSRGQGAPVGEAAVIRSGIRTADFPFLPRRQVQAPLTVLVPSRIKREKGINDAVLLLEELLKRSIPARLTLVGKVQSQDYFAEILDTVHKNGLDESFEYLPMVTHAELGRLYRAADVCFFPTYFRSGYSRVPLEAMASGCLVLTYGGEGSREVVRDGKTGFVLPEGDILSAANRIEAMIEDPASYATIIQNARRQVEREHTMERYIEAIVSFLQGSLAKNRP